MNSTYGKKRAPYKKRIWITDEVNLDIYETFDENETLYDDANQTDLETNNLASVLPGSILTNKEILFKMLIDNINLTEAYLDGSIIEIECNFKNAISEIDDTLYFGSSHKISDVVVMLEFLKTSNHLGDTTQSILLGLLGSLLPPDNSIESRHPTLLV